MNASTRRKLDMGARALGFSKAHPDESQGYITVVAQLEQLLTRADQLDRRQREGVVAVRAATARKQDLRHRMRRQQLVHVAAAAQRAAKELPELSQKFVLLRETVPYVTFRTLASTIATEAQNHKDLLVRHGMVERVLDSVVESLSAFDRTVEQGNEGRRIHVLASAELHVVADEVMQIVRVIDGLNRFRFAEEPELLRGWQSASNIVDVPHPSEDDGEGDAGGEVKPAA